MGIEYIMALITLAAVGVSFISVQAVKAQTAASITIAEKQIEASAEIAEKQIKAELVSANRQKWIEDLKTQIIEYFSAAQMFASGLAKSEYDEAYVASMCRAQSAIRLHLDPANELDANLGSAIEDLSVWLTGIPLKEDNEEVIQSLIGGELGARAVIVYGHARTVIKRELDRVKRGE